MAGAIASRDERDRLSRDHALMTAYFAGMLSQCDFSKMPAFNEWLAKATRRKRKATNAEIGAFFGSLVTNSTAKTKDT